MGNLIAGATLDDSISVRPYAQCIASPFGCQPARPSLGATTLAIASAKLINPFVLGSTSGSLVTFPNVASVVNAASYVGGAIAPGEIVAIFGTGLGPPTLTG